MFAKTWSIKNQICLKKRIQFFNQVCYYLSQEKISITTRISRLQDPVLGNLFFTDDFMSKNLSTNCIYLGLSAHEILHGIGARKIKITEMVRLAPLSLA